MILSDGFENLRDVRDRVEIALLALLGTYSYTDPNNVQVSTPSIYVVRNYATDPPRNWKRVGLECLIFPAKPIGRPFFNGSAQITQSYDIRLIQHDRSKDTSLAYRAMLTAFNDCQYKSLITQNDELDEQLNLSLFDTELLQN
jgi:hypothetical protein